MNLPEFVVAHTERGECKCGECIDVGSRLDPTDHTTEVAFFKVSLIPRFTEQPGLQCQHCAYVGSALEMLSDCPRCYSRMIDLLPLRRETKDEIVASLRKLSAEHVGEYGPCDPFDGREHNYMELGGWLDDRGMALRYMALGKLLGVFRLLTPRSVFGADISPDEEMTLAGAGLITIQTLSGEAP